MKGIQRKKSQDLIRTVNDIVIMTLYIVCVSQYYCLWHNEFNIIHLQATHQEIGLWMDIRPSALVVSVWKDTGW